jgi:hypothetical protein
MIKKVAKILNIGGGRSNERPKKSENTQPDRPQSIEKRG